MKGRSAPKQRDDGSMPKVSVIVPNYNHARFLRQRLDSILHQTFQDFELILLDDCSTDESRSILQEYAAATRVRLEFNEVNSGSTFKQWNKGVRLSQGKYVWIAESDDYADERLLEKLVARLDAEPRAVFAQCRSWRVLADGKLKGFQDECLTDLGSDKWAEDFRADGIQECRNYLVRCCSVQSASSVVFRREVYWEVGGADEKLRQCGDWKTWASMALTGGTISYVGEPLNYYRYHEASVSEKNLRNLENGVWAAETVHVIAWILRRVTPEKAVLARVRDDVSHLWIPAVLNRRIPLSMRRRILTDALTIDSRAFRRMIPPTLSALRSTLRRRWRSLRAASLDIVSRP
jgi:glycosyltransferase involved in cell wall biosynthesis